MRTFTRQAERYAGLGPVCEETYVCELGVGRLLRAGDVPLELHLPEPGASFGPDADAPLSAGGSPSVSGATPCGRSHWADLLERYFAGEPVRFALDLNAHADAHGFTSFERDVYGALAAVPYGTALSYRELAAAAGHPNAYRAVGSAMARNHLPVILPCHRVVKNDGRLGFYGDDPAWKARLLRLEGVAVHDGRLGEDAA